MDIGDNGSNRTIIFSFYFILVSYAYYIEVEGDTIELYAFCICSRSVFGFNLFDSVWSQICDGLSQITTEYHRISTVKTLQHLYYIVCYPNDLKINLFEMLL